MGLSTFFETFTIAFVVVIVAACLIGIGWIFTGKQKIQSGSCGRNPDEQRDASCEKQISCNLCKHSKSEEEKNESNQI